MGTLDEISRGLDKTYFESDLRTPTVEMCLEWAAWGSLNAAAPAVVLHRTAVRPPSSAGALHRVRRAVYRRKHNPQAFVLAFSPRAAPRNF